MVTKIKSYGLIQDLFEIYLKFIQNLVTNAAIYLCIYIYIIYIYIYIKYIYMYILFNYVYI